MRDESDVGDDDVLALCALAEELREELDIKEDENAELKYRVNELTKKNLVLKEESTFSRSIISSLEESVAQLAEELENSRLQVAKYDQDNNRMRALLAERNSEDAADLENNNSMQMDTIRRLRTRMADLEEQLVGYAVLAEELDADILNKEAEIIYLKDQVMNEGLALKEDLSNENYGSNRSRGQNIPTTPDHQSLSSSEGNDDNDALAPLPDHGTGHSMNRDETDNACSPDHRAHRAGHRGRRLPPRSPGQSRHYHHRSSPGKYRTRMKANNNHYSSQSSQSQNDSSESGTSDSSPVVKAAFNRQMQLQRRQEAIIRRAADTYRFAIAQQHNGQDGGTKPGNSDGSVKPPKAACIATFSPKSRAGRATLHKVVAINALNSPPKEGTSPQSNTNSNGEVGSNATIHGSNGKEGNVAKTKKGPMSPQSWRTAYRYDELYQEFQLNGDATEDHSRSPRRGKDGEIADQRAQQKQAPRQQHRYPDNDRYNDSKSNARRASSARSDEEAEAQWEDEDEDELGLEFRHLPPPPPQVVQQQQYNRTTAGNGDNNVNSSSSNYTSLRPRPLDQNQIRTNDNGEIRKNSVAELAARFNSSAESLSPTQRRNNPDYKGYSSSGNSSPMYQDNKYEANNNAVRRKAQSSWATAAPRNIWKKDPPTEKKSNNEDIDRHTQVENTNGISSKNKYDNRDNVNISNSSSPPTKIEYGRHRNS